MQKVLQMKVHSQEHSKGYYNVMAMAMNNSNKWLATIGMDQTLVVSDLTKSLKPSF